MEELVEVVILAGPCTTWLGHFGTLVPQYFTWKDVDVRGAFGVELVP
jgi:hypothetical protein